MGSIPQSAALSFERKEGFFEDGACLLQLEVFGESRQLMRRSGTSAALLKHELVEVIHNFDDLWSLCHSNDGAAVGNRVVPFSAL